MRVYERQWGLTRPFRGLKVLVATPVFRNTLLQYRALVAGGAELSVGLTFANDEKIVQLLGAAGVPVVTPEEALAAEGRGELFDLILDCAGCFAKCHPRIGFVELTRSGVQFYENAEVPVYVADSGIVKRIETSLGTGEGYIRALAELGYKDVENKNCVVFGSGKVGTGIVLQLLRLGACVRVVTDTSFGSNAFLDANGVEVTDCKDVGAVAALVRAADFVVTATGVKDALAVPELTRAFLESRAVLANMGVEDEFGADVPPERVLNNKETLNFILEEPTHLKYIDASLALHAALGEQLVRECSAAACAATPGAGWNGTKNPPEELEREILCVTMQDGVIGPEIGEMLGGLPSED